MSFSRHHRSDPRKASLLEWRCIGTAVCGVLTGDWKLLCDGVFASKMEAEVGGMWGGIWRGGR